jgi:alpha-galactosidase
MNDFEDQPRHDERQRVDSAVVWTATAGALVCSVVIFLATSAPSPEPVAEPVPSLEWTMPATTTSTVDTRIPTYTFDAVAPPQPAAPNVTTTPPSATKVNPPPAQAPPPPPPTTTQRNAGNQLRAVGAGKCLDVPNSTTTPGTPVQIWDCSDRPNQAWTRTAFGQLTVTLGGAAQCLDAYQQGTAPGTQVTIWPCNGQGNQRWRVNPDGTITGVQSGLCLDVTGAYTGDGAQVELWTCNGQSNQQWR